MGFPAVSRNAVIQTTNGRIDESEASFRHGKFPSRNNRFTQQNYQTEEQMQHAVPSI